MKSKAFTLIELLIVVAIIAILAAIAVPNFLEAQTRSKVSRARADMRSITTAIEAYAVDNVNKYPWVWSRWPYPGYALPQGPVASLGMYGYGMTTPVAYLTSIPLDPFGGTKEPDDPYAQMNVSRDYWYWTEAWALRQSWAGAWAAQGHWPITTGPGQGSYAKWALYSKGPDRRWAFTGPPGVLEVDDPYTYAYDPTNGTVSIGNIVRTGP
jgi:prepilin-type N-terminal cleavage/methylation domain-containing protein